jgi:glycosyltransferase involved in cell wall biosynthesis
LKILNVVQGYTPGVGGTELQIQRVSEELVRQFGDAVTVFTSDCFNAGGFVNPAAPRLPVGWTEINGVKVRRFHVINWAGPILKPIQWLSFKLKFPFNDYLRVWYSGPHIPELATAVRDFPADVTVAASFPLLHMFTTLNAAVQAGRSSVMVGSQHPEDRWGYDRPMIDKAIRRANAYIAMTDYEARYVISRGADAVRVTTIGNGVDPDCYGSLKKEEARKRLGLPQDVPIIGFIGQLGRLKGVDTLLQAMPLIWQSVPNAVLLLAGAKTSYQPHLQEIMDNWSAGQRQQTSCWYNFSDDLKPALYAALDVFTYPSGFESFGIAFLEAWAAGKPVIGCRRGAIPWVVDADVDGLLVAWQNVEALAEATVTLLMNSPLAQEMGEKGKRKVNQKYTWPVVARRFREVYVQAAQQPAIIHF